MSTRTLAGPYPLSQISVVDPTGHGVYVLSRGGGRVDYVGRGVELRRRIPASAAEGRGYREFWFAEATSERVAYHLECDIYHDYDPPDNRIHPAVPAGTNWRCPTSGCEWS